MSHHSDSSRRRFLKQLSGAGALALPLSASVAETSLTTKPSGALPIKHVLVSIDENRSFDHYYGYAPFVGKYGVPAGYTQPNGSGGTVTPQVFYSPITPNPNH